ncbi:hypothetical protein HUB97_04245 [Halorubraceae archaeon YAN]|nr:hypothetical protein [Halorubraceae archaeon YAN]
MRRIPLFVALLATFALFGGVAVASSAATISDDTSTTMSSELTVSDISPQTQISIQLSADRSASWEVQIQYELESDEEIATFEELAEEFESGNPTVGPQVSTFENFAALSASETDRQMEIESVSRSASLDGSVGTLTLEFVWTEFLSEDGSRLVLDDAFELGEDDRWLRTLGDNQELQITAPEGYSIVRSSVSFEENTVVQEGPHVFDREEHISMTFEQNTIGPANPDGVFGTWGLLFAGVVVTVAVLVGALLLRNRNTPIPFISSDQTQSSSSRNEHGMDSTGTPSETSGEQSTAPPDVEDKPEEDLSLLSDEERVERLLELNGGRMRQAMIVKETGWSDAKVSQLLSAMESDDQIEKLRLGRENLISLPEYDADNQTDQ